MALGGGTKQRVKKYFKYIIKMKNDFLQTKLHLLFYFISFVVFDGNNFTTVGTLIVATIYLQLIQNR